MKRFNQKGFTFIEVLATLTILSILCMLIIPSVYKYVTEGKRVYDYEGVAEQFLISGKSYFTENRQYLPVEGKRLLLFMLGLWLVVIIFLKRL